MTTHLVQRREQPLVTASDQGQKINIRDAALKNIGVKEREDNMDDADKLQSEFDKYIWNNPVENKLKTGHLQYTVNNLMTVLGNFTKSPEGSTAKVMLVLPDGRNPMQKEFNIREIRLVENKIIGAHEKYRCVILVD